MNEIFDNLNSKSIDINTTKESFESMVIHLLKNSSYTDIKNIEVKSQKIIVGSYRFLNRNDSYKYIKEKFNLLNKNISTTKPSSEHKVSLK